MASIEKRQRFPLCPVLFRTVVEGLPGAVRQDRKRRQDDTDMKRQSETIPICRLHDSLLRRP